MGQPDHYGTHRDLDMSPGLYADTPAWVYGGEPPPGGIPINVDDALDFDMLKDAATWLRQCKVRLDNLITDLKKAPEVLGRPVLADGEHLVRADRARIARPPKHVDGMIYATGPTKFGLLEQGENLAVTHANTFNSALLALTQLADKLGKAVEGTNYIIEKYQKIEEANAAAVVQIMREPPYRPGES